ncbi:MAG: flagellar motor protein MotB [Gammaproteobacteria bacterium]
MDFDKNGNQIIVRRVKKVKHGHHGGAWKVAFADFATALMAFFLVLWLLESATPKELQAISGYFNDPSAFTEGGSPYVIDLEGSLKDDPYSGDTPVETPEAIPNHGIILKEEDVETLAQEIEARKLDKLKKTLEARIEENPICANSRTRSSWR